MKQMYYLIGGITVIAIVCFLCSSCSKDEGVEKITDDKVSVDKTELTFSQKDESKELMLSCDGVFEWHLEAEGLERHIGPNGASVRDFTLVPAWGTGSTKVSVTMINSLSENYEVTLYVVGNKDNQKTPIKLKAIVN